MRIGGSAIITKTCVYIHYRPRALPLGMRQNMQIDSNSVYKIRTRSPKWFAPFDFPIGYIACARTDSWLCSCCEHLFDNERENCVFSLSVPVPVFHGWLALFVAFAVFLNVWILIDSWKLQIWCGRFFNAPLVQTQLSVNFCKPWANYFEFLINSSWVYFS